MKIIALIPAKNESVLLPLCLTSLQSFVDDIIVYDDHSTDSTARVALKYGATVITEDYACSAGWPEYEIRERLLREARAQNATHIIALDADEAITPSFAKVARNEISKLMPGDSLSMRWITLWKDPEHERVDGIFANLYKDFAYCDDKISHHQYAFLGVGRIPHSPYGKKHLAQEDLGGILHFQYVLWEKTQLKQAWYKCSELIEGKRSAKRINHTYAISMDGKHVITKPLLKEWYVPYKGEHTINPAEQWHLSKIIEFFDQYGIEFFEPLQIWHIPVLQTLFEKKMHRTPISKTFPVWFIPIIKLKNVLLRFVKQ